MHKIAAPGTGNMLIHDDPGDASTLAGLGGHFRRDRSLGRVRAELSFIGAALICKFFLFPGYPLRLCQIVIFNTKMRLGPERTTRPLL